MDLTHSSANPEPGAPKAAYINEKSQPHLLAFDDNLPQRPHSLWATMSSFRYALMLVLLLASVSMCYIAASPPHRDLRDAQRDPSEQSSFAARLSSVHYTAVPAAPPKCATDENTPDKSSEEITILQAIEKESAKIAASLMELARRQVNGSTNTTNGTVIVTSTPLTTVTTTSTTSVSNSGSGTTSVGETTVTATASSSAPVTVITTITSDGTTMTSDIVSTPSASVAVLVISGTKTMTQETGDGDGSGGTDSQPGTETTAAVQSSHTTVFLRTTTLPNGAASTITSTTVVAGAEQATAATATGATGTPSLQNAAQMKSFSAWALIAPGFLAALAM